MSFRQIEIIMLNLPATKSRDRHAVLARAARLNIGRGVFLALLLNFTAIRPVPGQSVSLSDSSISNVIIAVANHWQQTLADGSYPASDDKIDFPLPSRHEADWASPTNMRGA